MVEEQPGGEADGRPIVDVPVRVLREYEGLSYEEMARVLSLRKGTVESRLFRARERLKALLTPYL